MSEARQARRRQQKETLERIKKLIRANLVKIDLETLKADRERVGDTEAPSCGICIDEFHK